MELFLISVECQTKAKLVSGVDVKPIMSKRFGQRVLVDCVDFQCSPDGHYTFVLYI